MERIEKTDRKLYGDYSILVTGFNKDEQKRIIETAKKHSEKLKVVFAADNDNNEIIKDIFSKSHEGSCIVNSSLKKAVIMSGFLEKEVLEFMKKIKQADLNPKLWAVLTSTSENWKLNNLIKELEKESDAIQKMRKKD